MFSFEEPCTEFEAKTQIFLTSIFTAHRKPIETTVETSVGTLYMWCGNEQTKDGVMLCLVASISGSALSQECFADAIHDARQWLRKVDHYHVGNLCLNVMDRDDREIGYIAGAFVHAVEALDRDVTNGWMSFRWDLLFPPEVVEISHVLHDQTPNGRDIDGLIVKRSDGTYRVSFGVMMSLHDIGQEAVERMLEHPNEAVELVKIERGEAWTRTESLAVFVWETFFQAIARSVAETAPAVKARL